MNERFASSGIRIDGEPIPCPERLLLAHHQSEDRLLAQAQPALQQIVRRDGEATLRRAAFGPPDQAGVPVVPAHRLPIRLRIPGQVEYGPRKRGESLNHRAGVDLTFRAGVELTRHALDASPLKRACVVLGVQVAQPASQNMAPSVEEPLGRIEDGCVQSAGDGVEVGAANRVGIASGHSGVPIPV